MTSITPWRAFLDLRARPTLAYTMPNLSSLAVNGTVAIIVFPGEHPRGGAGQYIMQYLVNNDFIDAAIELPSDLFLQHRHCYQ